MRRSPPQHAHCHRDRRQLRVQLALHSAVERTQRRGEGAGGTDRLVAMMEAPHRRRMSCILCHVADVPPPAPTPHSLAQTMAQTTSSDDRSAQLLSDTEVQEFIRSGWMSIGPEAIGLPSSHVRQIYEDGCAWHDGPRDPGIHAHDNLLSEMPGLQDVCRSPAVHGALQSLLGNGYMLHPHGGFHPKPAGSGGQTFHKDGFFPGGGHGLRYHRPEYLLFFYYPQDTTEYMGPTEILPQSQYLSNDAELHPTHPLIGGGITGDPASVAGAADAVDSEGAQRYSAHVAELGWPNRTERLTVKAGSVVLTHFDVFHRGTHGPTADHPHRLMLKLWYVRCQDNKFPTWDHKPQADTHCPDVFQESRPPAADVEGQSVIWETIWLWMLGQKAKLVPVADDPYEPGSDATIAGLTARAAATHADGGIMDAALEPSRVSAAYQLADKGEAGAAALLTLLLNQQQHHANNISEFGLHGWGPCRSAAYALAFSSSKQVVPALAAAAAESQLRELRALAVFCLGQSISLDPLCVHAVLGAAEDDSSFVRSTAVAALGFAGRRLAAAAPSAERSHAVAQAIDTLISALDRTDFANDFYGAGEGPDDNFLSTAAAKTAGKQWAGRDGANTVRSAVRENAAISLCMILCTVAANANMDKTAHSDWEKSAAEVLHRVLMEETNKYVHAFAHEAVRRLSSTTCGSSDIWPPLWATFESTGTRWHPSHFQVEHSYVSEPSELFFVGGGR